MERGVRRKKEVNNNTSCFVWAPMSRRLYMYMVEPRTRRLSALRALQCCTPIGLGGNQNRERSDPIATFHAQGLLRPLLCVSLACIASCRATSAGPPAVLMALDLPRPRGPPASAQLLRWRSDRWRAGEWRGRWVV